MPDGSVTCVAQSSTAADTPRSWTHSICSRMQHHRVCPMPGMCTAASAPCRCRARARCRWVRWSQWVFKASFCSAPAQDTARPAASVHAAQAGRRPQRAAAVCPPAAPRRLPRPRPRRAAAAPPRPPRRHRCRRPPPRCPPGGPHRRAPGCGWAWSAPRALPRAAGQCTVPPAALAGRSGQQGRRSHVAQAGLAGRCRQWPAAG